MCLLWGSGGELIIHIYLNCIGLGSLVKIQYLKRLFNSQNPDIMLLQESLGDGGEIFCDLGKLFGGWKFIHVDARERSRGLIIGWRVRILNFYNIYSFDLGLGVVIYYQELDNDVTCLNIYGPYIERVNY
jgi:hypothetical protein